MEVDYRNILPGQLNPELVPVVGTPIARPSNIIDDQMAVYRRSMKNVFSPNVFQGVTTFRAIVLYAASTEGSDAILGGIQNVNNVLVKLNLNLRDTDPFSTKIQYMASGETVVARCMIPEINLHCPNPFLATSAQQFIDVSKTFYPIFSTDQGMDNNSFGGLRAGTIVTVRFDDPNKSIGYITNILHPAANHVLKDIILTNSGPGLFEGGTPLWGGADAQGLEPSPQSPLGLSSGDKQGDPPTWEGVEIHYTVTKDPNDAINVLKGRGLSYHYIISRKGEVINLVDPDYIAFHGGANNSRNIGISLDNLGNASRDAEVLGISTSGWTQVLSGPYGLWEPYPAAQITALGNLIKELKGKYPTLKYISGHEDNSGPKNDPGPMFDPHWNKFGLERGRATASVKNRNSYSRGDVEPGT